MGAMPNEPSMEEILSSIKRIIADEDRETPRVPRRAAGRFITMDGDGDDDGPELGHHDGHGQILELTEALLDDSDRPEDEGVLDMPPVRTTAKAAKPAKAPRARDNHAAPAATPPAPADVPTAATVLSEMSAKAARDSLDNLSKMLVRGEGDQPGNTLEALVREMLRPMLKEWLDKNLPGTVEAMVQREIDRISGRV